MQVQCTSFTQALVDAQLELFSAVSAMLPPNCPDLQDIVQETNLAIIRHEKDFDLSKPFVPWMVAFAKNQVKAYFKKNAANRLTFDDDLVDLCADTYVKEESGNPDLLRKLALCLKKLLPKHRELLDQHYFKGKSIVEIAREHHANPVTMGNTFYYIRNKLRDCIKRFCRLEEATVPPLEGDEETISRFLSGTATEADMFRARQILRDNAELRAVWVGQRQMDLLLQTTLGAQAGKSMKAVTRPAPSFSRFWRVYAAAAALVILLSLGLVAKHRFAAENAKAPRILKAIQPAAQTVPPAFEEKQAQTLPPPALTPKENHFAASAPATNLQQELSNGDSAADNTQEKEKDMNASMLSQAVTSAVKAVAATVLCFTPAEIVRAGTPYYWDNNGTAAGFGAAGGTWGADALWNADAAGLAAPDKTATGTGDDLYFGTASNGLSSGVVSLSGTNSFASLTFGGASGPITLTNGALNLAAAQTPIIMENGSNTIASVLTGSGGVHFGNGSSLCFTNFLTKEWQTVFPFTKLADIDSLAATFSGKSVSGIGSTLIPCFFVNDGTNATVQFQKFDGGWTKCVKVALRQQLQDVEAKAIYAKYYLDHEVDHVGFDFDTETTLLQTSTVATNETTDAYGISTLSALTSVHYLGISGMNDFAGNVTVDRMKLTFTGNGCLGDNNYSGDITNNGRIVFTGQAHQTLRGELTGKGGLTVYSGAQGEPFEIAWTNFLTTGWTVIASNAYVSDCTGVVASTIGGSNVNFFGTYEPRKSYLYATPCFFKNNGLTATCQLQAVDGPWLKYLLLTIKQDGSTILAQATSAGFTSSSAHSIGYDFENGNDWSRQPSIATSADAGGYGIAGFTLAMLPRGYLILSGTATNSNGMVIDGGRVLATAVNSMPASGNILVTNGGRLVLDATNGTDNANGGIGDGNPITVTSNSTLEVVKLFSAGMKRHFTLDGSTLLTTHYNSMFSDCENYINYLTLNNGSRVQGYPIRTGNPAAVYVIGGTKPSSLTTGLNLTKGSSLTINVADVTGDTNVDFFVSGPITDYNLAQLKNLPTVKTGPGTMSLATTNTAIGSLTIAAGAVRLDSGKALNASNTVILTGGSLSLGSSTNTAGALVLGTNATISLDKGQIAFADSSANAWTNGCKLTLSGKLEAHSLRFGTNKTALTASQLGAIRYDKRSVIITSEGYIKESPKGTVVMLM